MVHGDFKDLPRKAASDKVLHDKAFEIVCNAKYDEYQRELASMSTNIFDKKTKDTITYTGTGISGDQQLINELHRPITREFKKRKIYSSLRDKI